jgi:hypothetical protein
MFHVFISLIKYKIVTRQLPDDRPYVSETCRLLKIPRHVNKFTALYILCLVKTADTNNFLN